MWRADWKSDGRIEYLTGPNQVSWDVASISQWESVSLMWLDRTTIQNRHTEREKSRPATTYQLAITSLWVERVQQTSIYRLYVIMSNIRQWWYVQQNAREYWRRLLHRNISLPSVYTAQRTSVQHRFKTSLPISCRAMLCISAAYAVVWCLSVCLSVTFVHSVKTSKHILNFFFTSGWLHHSSFFRGFKKIIIIIVIRCIKRLRPWLPMGSGA